MGNLSGHYVKGCVVSGIRRDVNPSQQDADYSRPPFTQESPGGCMDDAETNPGMDVPNVRTC